MSPYQNNCDLYLEAKFPLIDIWLSKPVKQTLNCGGSNYGGMKGAFTLKNVYPRDFVAFKDATGLQACSATADHHGYPPEISRTTHSL